MKSTNDTNGCLYLLVSALAFWGTVITNGAMSSANVPTAVDTRYTVIILKYFLGGGIL